MKQNHKQARSFRQQLIFLMGVLFLVIGNPLLKAETLPESKKSPPAKTIPLSYSHVITRDTTYYLQGPQQAMPPQGTFKAGTQVNIIQSMGSYTRVKSENGIEAAVSTDSLRKIQ